MFDGFNPHFGGLYLHCSYRHPPIPTPCHLEMAALTTLTTRASSASLLRGHMASSYLAMRTWMGV